MNWSAESVQGPKPKCRPTFLICTDILMPKTKTYIIIAFLQAITSLNTSLYFVRHTCSIDRILFSFLFSFDRNKPVPSIRLSLTLDTLGPSHFADASASPTVELFAKSTLGQVSTNHGFQLPPAPDVVMVLRPERVVLFIYYQVFLDIKSFRHLNNTF